MCSSDETIHKILGLFGNFVLSRSAIRASILLHVKAPEDGGCGPLQELRFTEMQLEGLELSGSRSGQAVTVSRRLRFPPALVGPAFGLGNMRCGGLRAGDRPGSGISSGVFVAGGTNRSRSGDGRLLRELSVRRRRPICPADLGFWMGGVRRTSTPHFPAMAAPLPRVGELASPGPRSFSRRGAWVSAAKGGSRAELPAARKAARASGGFLETLKQGVCSAPPSGWKGSFGILARARGEPYGLEEASPPRGRQDRTPESRFGGMAGPTG